MQKRDQVDRQDRRQIFCRTAEEGTGQEEQEGRRRSHYSEDRQEMGAQAAGVRCAVFDNSHHRIRS